MDDDLAFIEKALFGLRHAHGIGPGGDRRSHFVDAAQAGPQLVPVGPLLPGVNRADRDPHVRTQVRVDLLMNGEHGNPAARCDRELNRQDLALPSSAGQVAAHGGERALAAGQDEGDDDQRDQAVDDQVEVLPTKRASPHPMGTRATATRPVGVRPDQRCSLAVIPAPIRLRYRTVVSPVPGSGRSLCRRSDRPGSRRR